MITTLNHSVRREYKEKSALNPFDLRYSCISKFQHAVHDVFTVNSVPSMVK